MIALTIFILCATTLIGLCAYWLGYKRRLKQDKEMIEAMERLVKRTKRKNRASDKYLRGMDKVYNLARGYVYDD